MYSVPSCTGRETQRIYFEQYSDMQSTRSQNVCTTPLPVDRDWLFQTRRSRSVRTPDVDGDISQIQLYQITLIQVHGSSIGAWVGYASNQSTAITYIILYLISSSNRWILSCRLKDLKRLLLQVLNASEDFSVHLKENENGRKWLYVRIAIILSTNAALLILNSISSSYLRIEFVHGYPFLTKTILLVLVISEYLLSVLPNNVFPVYCMLVCHYLHGMLGNMKTWMEADSPVEYERMTKVYIHIRRLVEAADDALSMPLFVFCLFHSTTMYLCVTSLLPQDEYVGSLRQASHWILFIGINFAFICLSREASLIYEHNAKIGSMARELMIIEPNPSIWQKKFVFIAEKELSLSVWKMTAVKRSFMFATLGTVLSYSILIHSLR
ncbi:hypothetical protein AVEN_51645-1 [Araneus ventricosus]|uniref:Gustatory receptor n=1 Tax=Araneus ventricosus TaxID=182803 RepID=A0A4Y2MU76_ARAVE|nr:hypothetical protein AVEN_51645-1 [Araneus ventricosus]